MSTDILSIRLGITNSYLLRGARGIVMVDAGIPGKIKAFKRQLARLYIMPKDIKLIILTHSHFDHIGTAKEIQELTGADVMIHKAEKKMIDDGKFMVLEGTTFWGKLSLKILSPFTGLIKFIPPAINIIAGDEDISLLDFGIDGNVIHTPGHSAGSISVLLKTGEAFVGCMAHAALPLRSSPGLPIYAEDINILIESWEKIIEKGARIIFPAHGKPFSVEIMKKIISTRKV